MNTSIAPVTRVSG